MLYEKRVLFIPKKKKILRKPSLSGNFKRALCEKRRKAKAGGANSLILVEIGAPIC
ncbi:MAG: hypothetical protein FWF60_00880 [Oscillospiraceae bacterium]|nr:hypothetical protein [Oscillospiraceae bacterium]